MKTSILVALLATSGLLSPEVAGACLVCGGQSPPAVAQSESSTVTFAIEGMSCRRCATSISEALRRVDGVIRAEVSHDERRARVEYDADRVSRERLMEVIRELGYRVEVAENG
jgi:copper chaperone CopZ